MWLGSVVAQLVPLSDNPTTPDRQWVRLGLPKDLRTPTQPAESLTLSTGDSSPQTSHAERILPPCTIPVALAQA